MANNIFTAKIMDALNDLVVNLDAAIHTVETHEESDTLRQVKTAALLTRVEQFMVGLGVSSDPDREPESAERLLWDIEEWLHS